MQKRGNQHNTNMTDEPKDPKSKRIPLAPQTERIFMDCKTELKQDLNPCYVKGEISEGIVGSNEASFREDTDSQYGEGY